MISPKDYIASKLRTSIQQCSIRCLHQSASWAAEQLIGLEDDQGNTIAIDESATNIFSHEEVVGANEIGVIMLSSSLLSMGQYQRCAHNLRSEGSRKIRSSLGIFMYAYSQYLAGEKQRAQQKDEKEKRNEGKTQLKNKKHDGFTDSDIKIKNPYLQQLYGDLLPIYSASKMDSFMLYIFAVITKDLHEQYGKPLEVVLEGGRKDSPELEPYQLFIQSLANNPWNW